MSKQLLPVLILAGLLSACASAPQQTAKPDVTQLKSMNFMLEKNVVYRANVDEAIDAYQSFLDHHPAHPNAAEAMRRVADLKLEKIEEKVAQQANYTYGNNAADYSEVIELYRQHLKRYPNFPHKDRVLYQLAKALDQSTAMEKASEVLKELVDTTPESQYVTEANFRIGEYQFVFGNYAAAEQAYQRVLNTGKNTPYFEKAMYKFGWTHFKQNNFQYAGDVFMELLKIKIPATVLDQGKPLQELKLSRGDREVVEDTLRALALGLSYQGGVESLATLFERWGDQPFEYLVYEQLANQYLDTQRYDDAAEVFLAHVRKRPWHPRSPTMQLAVIEIYQQGGYTKMVRSMKEETVHRYWSKGDNWNMLTAENKRMLNPRIKDMLDGLSASDHALSRRTKLQSDYDKAIGWYDMYLQAYPLEDKAAEKTFLYAELLFDARYFDRAAKAYEAAAYNFPRFAKRSEAAYAAILAYKEHENTLQGEERKSMQLLRIASSMNFARNFPGDKRVPVVLSNAAEELFENKDYYQAIDVATEALKLNTQNDITLQRNALSVLAHSNFETARYSEAEQAYGRLLSVTPKDDPIYTQRIEWMAAAIYKQGEVARKEENYVLAAVHFKRVGTKTPTASIVEKADFDVVSSYLAGEVWSEAIPALLHYRKRYPESELQGDVTQGLAVAYIKSGQKGKAASEYLRLADAESDPDTRREITWQAAELYEAGGHVDAALSTYKLFVRRFPEPIDQTVEVQRHIADLYISQGDYRLRDVWLREIIKANETLTGQNARVNYLAATAELTMANDSFKSFDKVQLVNPIRQNLARKKELMEDSLAAYARTADYGVADVTTAATYYIAEIYRRFSSELMDSERPDDLNADELEQYEIMLEEQAYPFEEQALDIHESNIRRIADGIYNEWIQKSIHQMAKLMPARYGKEERLVGVIRAIH